MPKPAFRAGTIHARVPASSANLGPGFDTLGLALALSRKGLWDETIASYRQAIELDPKNATAHNNLGVALSRKGQLDEAIACFRKAVELAPKNATVQKNLDMALAKKAQKK